MHIELVSDLTFKAFLACFTRFTGRRGCPSTIYSDNGTNFKGAWAELQEMQKLIRDDSTQELLLHYSTARQIDWKFSPSRAPHFGGLWEAGVKSMKGLLRKIVGSHHLTYEELNTIIIEAEATLNSRPLLTSDSLSEDGVPSLSPGHFLIGRPLCASPQQQHLDVKEGLCQRWNLVQKLIGELWRRWRTNYLHEQMRFAKWKTSQPDLKVGDIVLLKELDFGRQDWPKAKVMQAFPGPDGHMRVVEIKCAGKIYKRPVHKLIPLVSAKPPSQYRVGEDVQA